jgi:hypothetical protein
MPLVQAVVAAFRPVCDLTKPDAAAQHVAHPNDPNEADERPDRRDVPSSSEPRLGAALPEYRHQQDQRFLHRARSQIDARRDGPNAGVRIKHRERPECKRRFTAVVGCSENSGGIYSIASSIPAHRAAKEVPPKSLILYRTSSICSQAMSSISISLSQNAVPKSANLNCFTPEHCS